MKGTETDTLFRNYREGGRQGTYLKLKIIQGHMQNVLKCGDKTRTVLHFLKYLKLFESTGSQ